MVDYARVPCARWYKTSGEAAAVEADTWEDLSAKIPEHDELSLLRVAHLPRIQLQEFSGGLLAEIVAHAIHASSGAPQPFLTVEGRKVWLWAEGYTLLLESEGPVTAKDLRYFFPYLKDHEIEMLRGEDWEKHRDKLKTEDETNR